MRALLFAVLLLAPLALATHSPDGRCDGNGYPALGIIELTGGSAETTFYIDDRNYVFSNGIWMYFESNGIWSPKALPGVFADEVAEHDLQRGSGSGLPGDDGEICTDPSEAGPDLLLW